MLKKWLRDKLNGPVYLDCYTTSPDVYKLAKIKPANRYYPEWRDILPPVVEEPSENNPNITFPKNTMKLCSGLTDFYKNALCMPMANELVAYVGPEGTERFEWQTSSIDIDAVVHPQYQRGDFLPALKYQHVKIGSPWYLRCEEDVNFLMMDPFWNGDPYDERPFVPPGIVNYKYQHGTHINTFMRRPPMGDKRVEIKYNYPIAVLVPLTERKVIVRHHLVSEDKRRGLRKPQVAFNGAYYVGRKALMDTEKEEQCPMKSK